MILVEVEVEEVEVEEKKYECIFARSLFGFMAASGGGWAFYAL
jgi:hypothetical protein